jgi:hypothetical protein
LKFLAVLLTALVWIRHDTSYAIGDLLHISPRAAYYVLGGIQETVLWGLLFGFLLMYKSGFFRTLALGACVMGMVEGAMIPICRIALKGENTKDVCDYVTGLPISGVFTAINVLFLCWFLSRK